jgi:hypothetical protein
MSTDPEEDSQKKIEIERVPEPMFGGTRERLSVVDEDEAVSEDTGEKESNDN